MVSGSVATVVAQREEGWTTWVGPTSKDVQSKAVPLAGAVALTGAILILLT